MIRAIHLNLSHREVVFVVDAEGSPHGVPLILSTGDNGLPTFEEFTTACGSEITFLQEALEQLIREHPGLASFAPKPTEPEATAEPVAEDAPASEPTDATAEPVAEPVAASTTPAETSPDVVTGFTAATEGPSSGTA